MEIYGTLSKVHICYVASDAIGYDSTERIGEHSVTTIEGCVLVIISIL